MSLRSRPKEIGNTDTLIYEVPAGMEAAAILVFSNRNASSRTVTVKIYDASAATTYELGTDLPLAAKGSAGAVRKYEIPIALEAGDQLYAVASAATSVSCQTTIYQGDLAPGAYGLIPMGAYAGGTTYGIGDVVSIGGSSYVSRVEGNIGNTPASSPTQWQVLASKGDTGADGADGSGDVSGPVSSTNDKFPLWDGTGGDTLKDSAYGASSFATAAQGVTADAALPKSGGTMTGPIVLSADPASALHPATKQYVDGLAANIGKRERVRVATTANVTISTALNNGDTLDGITLATDDLVLVKNQSAPAENGVYVVGVSPARSSEYDTYNEHPGTLISVAEGTVNADTLWLCTSNAGGTLNTTAIAFSAVQIVSAASDTLAGIVELATTGEAAAGTDTARAVTPAGLAAATRGKQMVPIPAGAMLKRTTNGAADGSVELSSNKVMLATKDFDSSTQEHVQFGFPSPKQIDEGSTISFRGRWTAASGSGTVTWGMQIRATSDDDAIDGAYGTAQTVTDTLITANDDHRTDESSGITVGNTFAEGDMLWFQVYRDISDSLAVDAKLIAVEVYITTNAATDA